jgi:hypothetical protein
LAAATTIVSRLLWNLRPRENMRRKSLRRRIVGTAVTTHTVGIRSMSVE